MHIADPVYEATVSCELRRLISFSGRSGSVGCDTVAEAAPPPASADEQEHHVCKAPAPARWPEVVLRRDGGRPIRFRGLQVYMARSTSPSPAVGMGTLSLFAAEDGHVIAHLVYVPPETAPARPVYRVARITDATHLRSFVNANGPETCFSVNEEGTRHPVARPACQAMQISVRLDGIVRRPDCS